VIDFVALDQANLYRFFEMNARTELSRKIYFILASIAYRRATNAWEREIQWVGRY